METCVRGFSFKPETKVDDLKYVESEALERTWRAARRERLKQQEQKIWEEFVNEQDIVHNICKEDPYQFLNQLPEEYIKELLDIELQKMNNEKDEDTVQVEEQPASSMAVELGTHHTIVFSETEDKEDGNIFSIFDDDNDEEASGPDEERCDNDSVISPPCTVRERQDDTERSPAVESPDKVSRKSSGENVTNIIEGSIYCAKVKDIRKKINDELLNIIEFLEKQDIINLDPSDIPKLMKRSAEFCTRFNRVHMYQLQRQIADIERNSSSALPFGQRTQFQAQLVRVSSLHQNLLHALQILQKSLPQTACMKESAEMLRTIVLVVGEATRVSSDARPNTLPAAVALFDDGIQSTCEKLDETVNEYTIKMLDYLNSTENTSASCSKRSSKPKARKRSVGTWSKSGSKSIGHAEAALSMYSLATQRAGLPVRPVSSKDNQSSSGTSKMRASISSRSNKETINKELQPKSPKKTPRSRRPLMRAPQRTRPRRAPPSEQDVHTLVENVAPCASSHISREASPQRRSKEPTPRTPKPREPSRTQVSLTPRNRPNNIIARNKMAATSPVKKPPTPNNAGLRDKNTPRIIIQDGAGCRTRMPINKNESEETKIPMKDGDNSPVKSPRRTDAEIMLANEEPKRAERERNRAAEVEPASREVTRLVRQLCGGDNMYGVRSERSTGAKNAQLLCVNGGSPRQPSTPQLLRILEETIQKKTPRSLFPKQAVAAKDAERFRMSFNVPERVTDALFQYRTKFVQHMLTSSMYANSAVGKPWEMIGSVSEKIIDDLLLKCANQMELQKFVDQMYREETC